MSLVMVRECPQFSTCSCNVCPLDPGSALHEPNGREALAGEEQCVALRSTRDRIATAHGYAPGWARTQAERTHDNRAAAARAVYERRPVEQREAFARQGRERLASMRGKGSASPLVVGASKSKGSDGSR